MIKTIINWLAILLNVTMFIGLVYLVIESNADIDNAQAVVWTGIALGFPLINIAGLVGIRKKISLIAAFITNTLVFLFYSFVLFLILVWPLGSKPKGNDVIIMWSSYIVIGLTELILIMNIWDRLKASNSKNIK
ncbi:MAG: hypothetical protein JXB48_05155 [Candidatus Latescibacteria bacterium]|nr:hypothetical protein [Candidatus Latescibacterota bacterium]